MSYQNNNPSYAEAYKWLMNKSSEAHGPMTPMQEASGRQLRDQVHGVMDRLESGESPDSFDYSKLLRQGLDNGAFPDEIEWLQAMRDEKISRNPALEQYRNDETARRANAYLADQMRMKAKTEDALRTFNVIDFDEDEGTYTWAGSKYDSLNALKMALYRAKADGIFSENHLQSIMRSLDQRGYYNPYLHLPR